MRQILTVLVGLTIFSVSAFAEEPKEVSKEIFQATNAKISYALGMEIGQSLKRMQSEMKTELNADLFIRGFKDSLSGSETLIDLQQSNEIKKEFFMQKQKEQQQKMGASGDQNKADGEAFLEKNKQDKNVKVTDTGLQYMALTEGTGPKPKATDKVKVHYRGTLIDGTEFDSSYSRGQPTSFQLNQVIKGWTEGVQLMNVGSKYRFFVPSELAYGTRGAGGDIGPNATLIFEVELLGIE